MFIRKTLILLVLLIVLALLYNTYQPKHDSLGPHHESFEDMLRESGSDGKCESHGDGYYDDYSDFGNIWFPRSRFIDAPGGVVTGWPAKGGYYTKKCSLAELDFLGLDPFKPVNRSEDAQEEEAWCNRLRQLGARWNHDDYDDPFDRAQRTEKLDLYVGWPSDGGVWALQATNLHSSLHGLGRIDNALTMEGRWQKIKEFGGTFYAEPKDCPYLDLEDSKEDVDKIDEENEVYTRIP